MFSISLLYSKYNSHTEPLCEQLNILKLPGFYQLELHKLYCTIQREHVPHYCTSIINPLTHQYNTRRQAVQQLVIYHTFAQHTCLFTMIDLINKSPNIKTCVASSSNITCCCCLPTPMTLANGGSAMFPLVVHQPAYPSIWPAVQSPRRGLSMGDNMVRMWVQLKRCISTCSWGMRVQEGLCALGAWCWICQDLVRCYFYLVLLPLGPELWWVLCYILVLCVLLCWYISLSCVLRVCELLGETICNIFFGWLLFCCWMLWLCLVWVEVLYWIDCAWSSKKCACCACDPSVQLSVPSIGFCISEVISSFKSLRTGSQVCVLLMLFPCVIVHTMWSGKSLQLLCILPFGMLN